MREEMMTGTRIAVIIPFFQRTPYILAKALRTVFTQNLPQGCEVRVFIVDDSSPSPVSTELQELPEDQLRRITVIHQENGGPGAARNAALDAIASKDYDFVAFLDSDDAWAPTHLSDGIFYLSDDKDFYFCDHSRELDYCSYSETIKALQEIRGRKLLAENVLDSEIPVISVDPDMLVTGYLKDYLSQTSTVIVRASAVADLRFDPELRSAGEDLFFWLNLALRKAKTVVSWKRNVVCGSGVSIYFSAFDWSSTKSVDRVGYNFLMYLKIKDASDWRGDNRKHVVAAVRRYSRGYSFLFVRSLLRGKLASTSLLRRILRRKPWLLFSMLFTFLVVLRSRGTEAADW